MALEFGGPFVGSLEHALQASEPPAGLGEGLALNPAQIGGGMDLRTMLPPPPAPPVAPPPPAGPVGPGAPPTTSPIIPPGFQQNPQDLMRLIMQMILGENLRKFFGVGLPGPGLPNPSTFTPGGQGPQFMSPQPPQTPSPFFPGSPVGGMPNPMAPGAPWNLPPMGLVQPPRLPGPNPDLAYASGGMGSPVPMAGMQGPAGMMQGPMTWLTGGVGSNVMQVLNDYLSRQAGNPAGLTF